MKRQLLEPEFVKSVPRPMVDGVLYVSMDYATVAHKCCCGCGNDVFTRLSPKDWQLTFDGRAVSLYPSVGNWNFQCQSHYWIKENRVVWAEKWSKARIDSLKRGEQMEEGAKRPVEPSDFWRKVRRWWK